MYNNKLKYLLPILILGIIIINCEKEVPSWTDPHPAIPGLKAEITSIEPDTAFGGEIITINGSNFSTDPENNFIVFGKTNIFPISATETALEVIVPVYGGLKYTTIPVKVTVKGSEYYSEEVDFTYPPVLEVVDEYVPFHLGVAVDDSGNVYTGAHCFQGAGINKVWKITPSGDKTVFLDGVNNMGAIKVGTDNQLYVCCCGEIKVFTLDGNQVNSFPITAKDIAWDADGNLYHCFGEVYCYDGATSTLVEDLPGPKSLRVFENYLYVSHGTWDTTTWKIVKYEIKGDGTFELAEEYKTECITFGIDLDYEGTVYYSNVSDKNGPYVGNKIHYIKQDGTRGIIYDGMAEPGGRFMKFHDKFLYVVACWGELRKFYIGTEQAPEYP